MKEYHKIQTVFKRDPANNMKTLLIGEYSEQEFEYLAYNDWIYTEKVDGINIRVMLSNHEAENGKYRITFGGKTDNAQIPTPLVDRLQSLFLTDEKRTKLQDTFPKGACLFGEGYGARIQKGGGNYRPDVDFVLFDVKVDDLWLRRSDIEDIASKLNLDAVPIIGIGRLHGMVEYAKRGFNSNWGPFPAEGIVARPTIELKTRLGCRIITKIKTKDFKKD